MKTLHLKVVYIKNEVIIGLEN